MSKENTMMNVKIDTREKFHVITILEPSLHANMTEELMDLLHKYGQKDVKNIVLNLEDVSEMDISIANGILASQQRAYEQNSSFVLCEIQAGLEEWLEQQGFLEMLNVTPTESEAWDIVQMEEIERELMDGFES